MSKISCIDFHDHMDIEMNCPGNMWNLEQVFLSEYSNNYENQLTVQIFCILNTTIVLCQLLH